MSNPKIRIVNDAGLGQQTKIFYGDKEISNVVTEAEIFIKVGEPVSAKLTTLVVNGEICAEVEEIKEHLVPPPLPKTETTLQILAPSLRFFRMRSKWVLTRRTPLTTWGTVNEVLAEGYTSPIGPLKVTQES